MKNPHQICLAFKMVTSGTCGKCITRQSRDTTLSTSSRNLITTKKSKANQTYVKMGMVGNGSSISVGATADPGDEESFH